MDKSRILILSAAIARSASANADDALIAVATNFFKVATQLEEQFEAQGRHRISLVSGSTGKIYAQVINGAPFTAFLAADQARPGKLLEQGYGVPGSQFTYVVGGIVLAGAADLLVRGDLRDILESKDVTALALANPALAPYGLAAKQALEALVAWDLVRTKIVLGENVGQAYAMVATGNAQLGFLARSMAIDTHAAKDLAFIDVPSDLHAPIRQDAILLENGRDSDAARAFLEYLQSDAARTILIAAGYESG